MPQLIFDGFLRHVSGDASRWREVLPVEEPPDGRIGLLRPARHETHAFRITQLYIKYPKWGMQTFPVDPIVLAGIDRVRADKNKESIASLAKGEGNSALDRAKGRLAVGW